MVIVETGNVITVTFDPDEMLVIDWVTANYSTNELNVLLTNYLTQKKAQMNETKKAEVWDSLKDHPEILQTALDAVALKEAKVI